MNITTFSELVNILVLEEWKNKIPFYLVRHVETSGEIELCQAAELTDAHAMLVESWGGREREKAKTVRQFSGGNYVGPNGESRWRVSHSRPVITCKYCKKVGHNINECPHPGCK